MIKVALLILTTFLFTACVNKHGISAQYYSDCKEYYDLQGYYHKECGEDDIVTYETMKKTTKETGGKIVDTFTKKKPAKEESPDMGSVW